MDLSSMVKELILGVPVVGEVVANNPVEVGGGGLLTAVILFAIAKFLNREKLRRVTYRFMSRMNKLLGGFDIPIVFGQGEESIKNALRTTMVDVAISIISAKLNVHPDRLYNYITNGLKQLRFKNPAEEEAYRKKK
jgi:hypothetical protein